jgi:DNA-directed RNA polymerase subunit L
MLSPFFSHLYESPDQQTISFYVHNEKRQFPLSLTASLRRIILSNIETFTMERTMIQCVKNTSMLNDDVLTHRLSLIPLKTEWLLEHQLGNNIDFVLDVKQLEDEKRWIFASDIQFMHRETKEVIPVEHITTPTFLIAALRPRQELHMKGSLFLAHPKKRRDPNSTAYGATSIYYGASYDVAFVNCTYSMDTEQINKIMEESALKGHERMEFLEKEAPRMVFKNEYDEPCQFTMTVESFGCYSPYSLIRLAFQHLKRECTRMKTALDSKDESTVQIMKHPSIQFEAYDFRFKNQDDTTGNYIYEMLLMDPNVTYIGYNIPHPLEPYMVIRLALNATSWSFDENTYRLFLVKKLLDLENALDVMIQQWTTFYTKAERMTEKPDYYAHPSNIVKPVTEVLKESTSSIDIEQSFIPVVSTTETTMTVPSTKAAPTKTLKVFLLRLWNQLFLFLRQQNL